LLLILGLRPVECVGLSNYKVGPDQDQIRAEIMKHGPIQVEMMVYEDFLSYKSGE